MSKPPLGRLDARAFGIVPGSTLRPTDPKKDWTKL